MKDGPTYTKSNESCRLQSYDDATGKPLEEGDLCEGTCSIAYGDTGPDVVPGLRISQEEAEARFARKYPIAMSDAIGFIGAAGWNLIGPARQIALIDLSYQLGFPRLVKFSKMLVALCSADWPGAAHELLTGSDGGPSRYAKQAPNRAARNAAIFAGTAEP